ncbi:MAG: C40 family peptidase [Lachnospiraceae bacterium]|nr:C40 family peptidase [Lachnospiraceae bacterium]
MKKRIAYTAAAFIAVACLTVFSMAAENGALSQNSAQPQAQNLVVRSASLSAGITRNIGEFLSQEENNKELLMDAVNTAALERQLVSFAGLAADLAQERVEAIEAREAASPYANVAISRVNNFVNIRAEANTTSEVLGKIYNNSAATILDTVEGEDGKWFHIKSGSVKGYIKSNYFLTGTKAEEVAKKVGDVYAVSTVEMLRLREKPSTDAKILDLLDKGEKYLVTKEGVKAEDGTEFVKVLVSEGDDGSKNEGYIAAQYVDIKVKFKQAISIEEEKAELERLERLRKEAEEAKRKAEEEKKRKEEEKKRKEEERRAAEQRAAQQKAAQQKQSRIVPPDTSSGIGNAIKAYALQFVGNRYVMGGTSLTNGADCSGFVQSVYRDCGLSVPRISRQQATGGRAISINELQIGDLVFYGSPIHHVAIYIGGGKIVHAQSSRTGIVTSSMYNSTPVKFVTYFH